MLFKELFKEIDTNFCNTDAGCFLGGFKYYLYELMPLKAYLLANCFSMNIYVAFTTFVVLCDSFPTIQET